MKKKISFIGLFLLALIISGCGSNSEESSGKSNDAPTFDDVYTNVENAVKETLSEESGLSDDEVLMSYFIEDLTADDAADTMAAVLLERMALDLDILENGKAIGAMMNVNADEIFVLEAKSEEDVAALKEILERELDAQTRTWEQYLPDQHEKVKNNVIETKGNFLLYVTFSSPDEVVEAFKAAFK